jgi:hypothetical protein
MNRNALYLNTALALTAALALAACGKQDATPAPDATPPASLPRPASTPAPVATGAAVVTGVAIGNSLDANGRVGAGSSSFATTDTLIASISTSTGAPTANVPGTLGARWLFEDGQVVQQESKALTFSGPGVTNFQISKPDGWPVGRYTLEVSLDGRVVQSAAFDVR